MNPKWPNCGTIFNWLLKRITVLLIVLRACDVTSLPWWGVLAPLWVWLGVVLFGVTAAGITEFVKRVKDGL